METAIAFYSDPGCREQNEDHASVIKSNAGTLAIVADGLGGLEHGEIASRTAASVLGAEISGTAPDEETLIQAILKANKALANSQIPGHPMCTTIAVLWIGTDTAIAANVGDSRIYQFRHGHMIYRSLDHSAAQMAVLAGEITEAEIRTSSARNRLTRALGESDCLKVAATILSIQPGDHFLLCSDGFWEPVLESDMESAISISDTPQDWLDHMRQIVRQKHNPRQDNHTAVCITVTPSACDL